MMALLRRAFFFRPAREQVWESRSGLPPFKVKRISQEGIFVVDANIAFEDCWGRNERWYAKDIRQWRDRLAEEHRRLKK
jgi:hypothetical protein